MENKAQIIRMFREEFMRWEELLAGLSTEQITAKDRIEKLSILDILAHLTAWQQISASRLQAALHGGEPVFPGWLEGMAPDTEEDLDKINSNIYDHYLEHAWVQLHREWQERYQQILEMAESVSEKDLLETGRVAWLKEYPLSAVLMGSIEHHAEHLDQLLVLLKHDQQKTSD